MEPSGIEAYRLGRHYDVMPIAMVPEACIEVPAGPLTFVVEARRLTDEAIHESSHAQGRRFPVPDATGVDDGGATLHVLGTADGLEHLRFDCFENEPHYHYIDNAHGANTVVRLDDAAEGDPTRWTLERVRTRLPEMLEHAGVPALAAEARAAREEILASVPRVEQLLGQASG